MARKRRRCPGGLGYHVFNRATARERIFDDAADCLAFERVLAEAHERSAGELRLCSYVIMPNHFHLVLWPKTDDALTRFVQWLTLTHAQRWHAHRRSAGTGALYGSRFQKFPHSRGRAFSESVPIRRAQSAAGGAGEAGAKLAVGKPVQA